MDLRLRGTGGEAALFRREYPTEKAEAEGVARRISRLIGGASFFAIDSGNADNGAAEGAVTENAVLIRSAALAPPIIKALRDHGIPFEFTGETLAGRRTGADPARSFAEQSGFSRRGPGICPCRGLSSGGGQGSLGMAAKKQKPGGGEKQGSPESLERLFGLAALCDDLSAFLENLAIRGAGDAPDIRREGVKLMTIHASKGLEFDHVFIAALEDGLLPFTLYGEQDMAEERRLLYVAMTRARQGLYLFRARKRIFQG
jgi:superfamily I DNA/RNA helicase